MPATSTPFYSERRVKTWAELKELLKAFDSNWAFRGQGDSKWGLQTSIERTWPRTDRDTAEKTAIALYKRKAAGLRLRLPAPSDSLGLLAEMQHFGAPTRLQDWTKSQYAAAFFAFAEQRDCDCAAIWATDLAWQKARALTRIRGAKRMRKALTIRDVLHSPSIFDGIVMANKSRFVLPATASEMNERLGVRQEWKEIGVRVQILTDSGYAVGPWAELESVNRGREKESLKAKGRGLMPLAVGNQFIYSGLCC